MPDYCIAERTVDPKSNVTVKIYDGLGRIKYVIDGDYVPGTPVTSYMTYNYYDTGNLQSVVYPNNYKEEYFYKKDNRLEKLINWKYDGKNLVKMDEYVYIYDGADNIDTKKEKINGSTTEIVTSYQYDSLNRLTNVNEQSKNRVTVYTFDPAGNRDTETITIIKGSNEEKTYRKYNYDLQNRLDYTVLRKTDANGAILEEVDYQTDKNGNVIKITVSNTTGNSITENTYDVLNRLTKTSIDGVVVTENIYNAEGLRIVKKSEGSTTRYFYEYDKIVLEISTDTWGNVEQAQNIYGTNLLKRKVGTDAVYYMYNGHGDVTALIDASFGYLRGMYYYDAFGNQSTELIYGDVDGDGQFNSNDYSYMRQFLIGMITEFPASTGAIAADVDGNGKINTDDYAYAQQILIGMIRYFPADKNEDNLINDSSMFGYTGYFYDAETGLYYLNSRMYDPTTARFLQEDTYTGEIDDPLSLNLYTYCANNPLMYFDLTGNVYIQISPGVWRDVTFSSSSWDYYKNMDSNSQQKYLNRYVIDTSVYGAGAATQRAAFQQELENSTQYKITSGIEEGWAAFTKKTIIDAPVSIAQTCYSVYAHPFETLNNIKDDISYLNEHPTALIEGLIDTGKEVAVNAYENFKNDVINGDAGSRARYFTENGLDALSILITGGQLKAARESAQAAKAAREIMEKAAAQKASQVATTFIEGRNSYKNTITESTDLSVDGLSSLRPVDILKQGLGDSNIPKISSRNLYKELGKSKVGRQTLDLIEQNGVDVTISYTDVRKGLMGRSYGNQAVAYARNTQSISETAKTIIHEVTHVMNPGKTKRLEMFARIRELKHIYGNEKIPTSVLREEFEKVYKSGLYDDYADLTGERLTSIMGNK